MKQAIHTVLIFLILSLLTACQQEDKEKGLLRLPEEAAAFEEQQRIAVIVGIDSYASNSKLRKLDFAVNDAKALAKQFEKQGYIVKLLTNSDAKKYLILQTIAEAGKVLDNNQGTLVFVFTGHGYADDKNDNYLAVDGTTAFNLADSGLRLDKVKQQIRATGARRSMMFIDACRDNPTQGKSVSNPSFMNLSDSEGLNILYSTAQGDVSYESPQFKHGVFSHFLLEALQGAAAQEDG